MSPLSSASVHEAAGRQGALPSAIKPLDPSHRVEGTAFTVRSPPGDNLWFHRALAAIGEGDVLVASVGGGHEWGYWGDVMTLAAMTRGVRGLVIDGSVRDGADIVRAGFPVFARGLCIRGTGKDPSGAGELQGTITIGDVSIGPKDWILGDGDGVVVVARPDVERVLSKAAEREAKEEHIREALRSGKTTLEIYGLE